nr:MAG TPA_asm: hypothetical protein [Caudoviricetes sp.]
MHLLPLGSIYTVCLYSRPVREGTCSKRRR